MIANIINSILIRLGLSSDFDEETKESVIAGIEKSDFPNQIKQSVIKSLS